MPVTHSIHRRVTIITNHYDLLSSMDPRPEQDLAGNSSRPFVIRLLKVAIEIYRANAEEVTRQAAVQHKEPPLWFAHTAFAWQIQGGWLVWHELNLLQANAAEDYQLLAHIRRLLNLHFKRRIENAGAEGIVYHPTCGELALISKYQDTPIQWMDPNDVNPGYIQVYSIASPAEPSTRDLRMTFNEIATMEACNFEYENLVLPDGVITSDYLRKRLLSDECFLLPQTGPLHMSSEKEGYFAVGEQTPEGKTMTAPASLFETCGKQGMEIDNLREGSAKKTTSSSTTSVEDPTFWMSPETTSGFPIPNMEIDVEGEHSGETSEVQTPETEMLHEIRSIPKDRIELRFHWFHLL
ncbi:hypothetical protein B7494_g93 [Chlorociboria aeruginascens]|nr:hypothetical protein B7494_g93 [Chlorociboria aeruginascens]